MHSEEEARKVWCPFARIWSFGAENAASGGWNRHPRNSGGDDTPKEPFGANCIASECSQWEEGEEREERRVYQDADGRFPKDYQRTSSQGCAVFKGELWNYEHTDVDRDGRFDLLHRATGNKAGDCGLKRRPE